MSLVDEICDRNSYIERHDNYLIAVKPYNFENRKSISVNVSKDEMTIGELQAHFEDDTLYIRSIFVKKNFQRIGIGKLLVRKSKEAVERIGLTPNRIIALRVYKESRDFWKALGFREKGLDYVAEINDLKLD